MRSWQILFRIAWGCLAAAVVFVFVGGIFSEGIANIVYNGAILLFLAWSALLVVSLVERIKDPEASTVAEAKRRARAKKANERREARKPVVEARRKRKEEKMQLRAEKRKYRVDNHTPVEAILISTEAVTRTSKGVGRAFGRAIIGDILFGAAGAFIGASTTSSKTRVVGQTATFFVTYKTGRQGTEKVLVDSERFALLWSKVKYISGKPVENPQKNGQRSRNPSTRLRFEVLYRDKFTCRFCGASPTKDPSVTLHVDHIIPWSKGGETSLDNLQTLCSKCNLGKSDLMIESLSE